MLQSGNEPQGGGFAATGRTDQRKKFVSGDDQRNTVNSLNDLTICSGESLGDVLQFDARHGGIVSERAIEVERGRETLRFWIRRIFPEVVLFHFSTVAVGTDAVGERGAGVGGNVAFDFTPVTFVIANFFAPGANRQ
jgi:hypothetical protein